MSSTQRTHLPVNDGLPLPLMLLVSDPFQFFLQIRRL
jgi:hypothetical protein